MLDTLHALPTPFGLLVFMGMTCAAGLAVYLVSYRLIEQSGIEDHHKDLKDATGNLFRVVGWLFTLLLSLTFTQVLRDTFAVQTAIESEARAISDADHDVRRLDKAQGAPIRELLIGYANAVIRDEWRTLVHEELDRGAGAFLRKIEAAALRLEARNPAEEALRARIIADVDLISDHRLTRLLHARAGPPIINMIAVLFGYFVTMICFGVYRPRRVLLLLVALYTLFVGMVVYFVVALADPFEGMTQADPGPFEHVLEVMQSEG